MSLLERISVGLPSEVGRALLPSLPVLFLGFVVQMAGDLRTAQAAMRPSYVLSGNLTARRQRAQQESREMKVVIRSPTPAACHL
jgi:hypothetical protein